MKKEELYIGFAGKKAIIKIVGHGNMNISPTINKLFSELYRDGTKDIIFDLSECQYMDSTCIGVLCNITVKMKKVFDNPAFIGGLTDSVKKSFEVLHVLPLFQNIAMPLKEYFEVAHIEIDDDISKEDRTKVVLDAHETLSSLDQENKITFQNVIKYLKEKMKD